MLAMVVVDEQVVMRKVAFGMEVWVPFAMADISGGTMV
jgi:hypothetical protein